MRRKACGGCLLLGPAMVLGAVTRAWGGEAPASPVSERPPLLSTDLAANLYGDVTLSGINEPNEDATLAGSAGLNYGTALVRDLGLGAQVGGDFTIRRINPELDLTAGVFKRNCELPGELAGGGAVLVDFRHTQRKADLFALRPIGGVATPAGDLGVTASIPLGSETVRRRAAEKRIQRMIPRVDVSWSRRVTEEVAVELAAGYMFGDVDSTVVGGQLLCRVAPEASVAGMGEINFEGDYAVGISLIVAFGSGRGDPTLRRFRNDGAFTPFPKRSFPSMLVETKKRKYAAAGPARPPEEGPPEDQIPPSDGEPPYPEGDDGILYLD